MFVIIMNILKINLKLKWIIICDCVLIRLIELYHQLIIEIPIYLRKFNPDTWTIFKAINLKPLASNLRMISPTRPRCTPSGLIATKVRSRRTMLMEPATDANYTNARLRIVPKSLQFIPSPLEVLPGITSKSSIL